MRRSREQRKNIGRTSQGATLILGRPSSRRGPSKDLSSLLRPATLMAGATMTVDESKALKKGTRVYWRGDAADSGIITETKAGMRLRSPGTMGSRPECTTETCVKFSKGRQSRIQRNGSRTNPLPPLNQAPASKNVNSVSRPPGAGPSSRSLSARTLSERKRRASGDSVCRRGRQRRPSRRSQNNLMAT